ncbi:hypothetical protein A2160_06215 [Candidatus Beckwithbacteria bacterium RBG_13_42_9]|uniref:GIY-YIG domain-containing protein n=1 Tax=Candidatus Beckwithbacteria bacterium RBG_13_42_9 TaxID=1797457 RepID=A0A1F5E5F2_9BACT|nr:MAG: hypothetical protein A2160_06215 [Candidatus Beckwithbacteria bacterium RBG_13_42_9]
MHYFYILRCSDNSLYCGQTNNIERRIKEHNSNNSKSAHYTKLRRPVTFVYSETFNTIQESMKRERQVKKWTKAKKEALIQGNEVLLKKL